jgi:hypothetical protein
MRVSAPTRAIVDAAESGAAPDQILLAIRQTLDRALASQRELEQAARGRPARVKELIRSGIQGAHAR